MTEDELARIEAWASRVAMSGDYAHDARTENEHRQQVMALIADYRALYERYEIMRNHAIERGERD